MKKLFTSLMVLSTIALFSFAYCAQEEPTKSQPRQPLTLTQRLQQDPQLIPQSATIPAPHRARKDWNFIVYFAANNNLHQFAIKNIQQMLKVGSTNTMNVVIQLDELGAKEITRYYVQKGSVTPVFHNSNTSECVTGTQESLYNFILWTLQNYPANHNCLVLWNHGAGIKDPSIWGKALLSHRNELFVLNKTTGLYELNRKLSRQYAAMPQSQTLFDDRGIAFNDTFQAYLTNQDLQTVLERVSRELLSGKKIDILCMDACMMEMAEVGSQVKNAVTYMVGSQEVEPGDGYDYSLVLSPFEQGTIAPDIFAKHIVQAYSAQYYSSHADYTQSAINATLMPALEANFAQVSQILTTLISSTNGATCAKIIKDIRQNSARTLEFDDPDYIDLGKFYTSLQQSLANTRELAKAQSAVGILKDTVAQGITLLQHIVIANVAGSALSQATGLSFFFPIRSVHPSYLKTVFDQTTHWAGFLAKYLKTRTEETQPQIRLKKRKK